MTPSAYMTDDAWKETTTGMCEGIRAMEKIKDHGDFWVLLSLHGFGSHLNMDALEVSASYKILVVKEEGDSSQVCQAYDQQVTRQDKAKVHELLDGYRFAKHGVLTEMELILIINTSLNKVNPMAWQTSFIFITFNTCPS